MPCAVCGHEFTHDRSDGPALLREVMEHFEESHDPSW